MAGLGTFSSCYLTYDFCSGCGYEDVFGRQKEDSYDPFFYMKEEEELEIAWYSRLQEVYTI